MFSSNACESNSIGNSASSAKKEWQFSLTTSVYLSWANNQGATKDMQ
jgi:hypothetical protein